MDLRYHVQANNQFGAIARVRCFSKDEYQERERLFSGNHIQQEKYSFSRKQENYPFSGNRRKKSVLSVEINGKKCPLGEKQKSVLSNIIRKGKVYFHWESEERKISFSRKLKCLSLETCQRKVPFQWKSENNGCLFSQKRAPFSAEALFQKDCD